MKVAQEYWTASKGWEPQASGLNGRAQLVVLFGSTTALADPIPLQELRARHPSALLFGCSTAGEIFGTRLFQDSLVATSVEFASTRLRAAQLSFELSESSLAVGKRLAEQLPREGLTHVFVLSDGIHINGSELVRGMLSQLPAGVQITGGLSGDGEQFRHTLVVCNDAPKEQCVAALGFYGDRLQVGYGSLGGWDAFGPDRVVTRAKGNILYELDGQPALALYKKYLGEHAAGLPATGLLFPLSVRMNEGGTELVRTILGVNEQEQSMTFAGDVPEGAHARLMKANFDRLIDGAQGAAHASLNASSPSLAILISCVGRKLVLQQRTEEELEAVRDVFGERTALTGFYSYGEICPAAPNANCELHNQTMTITTFSESERHA